MKMRTGSLLACCRTVRGVAGADSHGPLSPALRRLRFEPLEDRCLLDGSLFGAELFADFERTVPGLIGTYIDHDLSDVNDADDWRVSQTVAGTRVDSSVEFLSNDWGQRAEVGLTEGSDTDWQQFSVQWDGFLEVTGAGQRFATISDDGSRMWIDLDRDGAFEEEELLNNGWGRGHGPTTGDRTAGLASGVYAIRIQYCEIGGDNVFTLATSPYVPRQFVPTPTNPRQIIRAVVLNFDPRVPAEQNRLMHEVFDWSNPRQLATQFERDLEWVTGGAIDVQIVEWRDLDAFPTFTDGFRYNPDDYVRHRRENSGWHDAGTDFYELVESQDLLPMVNSGAIDEIWVFGDHYFGLLGETWMGGPNSFFINGPSFSDVGFDRAVAGYGFNYERGVAEMLHNLGHRTENHGQRAFGAWNLFAPVTAWDRFSSNYLDTAADPYGVGTCHVPANADEHYDYGDPRVVSATSADFVNYPDLTGAAVPVGRETWSTGPNPDYHRDYLDWYFAMMPRNDGTADDGRAANWFKYIWDFNSYEAGSGLARGEDAFGAGPIVRHGGATAYDLTVRYYDQTGINPETIDVGDVRISSPGGTVLVAEPLGPGVQEHTTAGTARTVTYRITPPGGSWDVLDNGIYRILMQADQVHDTAGNAVPSGQVGSFRVAVTDPSVINIAAMLAAGEADVTHTPLDIGPVNNLFDGNTATLVCTPNIDPAVVTLSFQSPQTVTGLRSYFSHASGDPAIRYTVETADSLADLDGRTGTYHELVSLTGTTVDRFSTVTLASPHAATHFRLTANRLHGDDYVHVNEWQLLGMRTGETDGPTATLTPVSAPLRGATAQFISVTFSDATGIDVASIGNGDLLVTGPGSVSIAPTFYDVDDHTNGSPRMATYWFIPPGGAWDHADNGTYTVELRAAAVHDVLFNASPASQALGTFQVNLKAPQIRPSVDLAEANAADWIAWADAANASAGDDAIHKLAGTSSVRFDTSGGFDTSLSYPAPGVADWDLTTATSLHFSVYAENLHSFQEGPRVRLNGTNGGYFEYRYYNNSTPAVPINSAIGRWTDFTVPLNPPVTPTGWQRSAVGTPSLEHVGSVEFHADTWDSGFTLWFDDVGFDLPPASVTARHVFYNGSTFDWDPSADNDTGTDGRFDPGEDGPNNDAAIATDKTPLLSGYAATFANYTSYSRGINGIIVDIAGLANPDGLNLADPKNYFAFHVGNDDNPSGWPEGPPPDDVTIRESPDTPGADRVTLVWPDYAIRNTWLQVTVLGGPDTNLGLPAADVFYFGNAIAEAGNSTADAKVTVTDLLLARNNPRSLLDEISVTFPYDFDRDGKVNATDVLLARNNQTSFLNALNLIDLTGGAAEAQQPPLAELAWLSDLDQAAVYQRPAQKDAAAEAVDKLLATYWP